PGVRECLSKGPPRGGLAAAPSTAFNASPGSTVRRPGEVGGGCLSGLARKYRCLFGWWRWGWVLGLVEAELAAIGHLDRCDESPAFVADRTAELDSFASEFGDRRVDVVAHEVELVMADLVGWVRGQFGGWQGED